MIIFSLSMKELKKDLTFVPRKAIYWFSHLHPASVSTHTYDIYATKYANQKCNRENEKKKTEKKTLLANCNGRRLNGIKTLGTIWGFFLYVNDAEK